MSTHLHHVHMNTVAPGQQQPDEQPGMRESNRQSWDSVNLRINVNCNEEGSSLKSPSPRPSGTIALADSVADSDETDSKELEIHRCLTGNGGGSDHEVDLIHLRKLAESPGGLKTMALRRLAWPKLVAAHQVLWGGPPLATTHPAPTVTSREIHRLVKRTKWSKYQITKSPKTFDELLGLVLKADVKHLPTPRQSFADLSSEGASDSINTPTTPTNRIRRVSFDLDSLLDEADEPSHRQLLQMAKDERQVLRKLLLHIYRCHPDAPMYDGLQNLIAVLWIVIESPSLTSITSLQLIQYQWMPQAPDLFMKLLALWDPTLHQHFCFHQENLSHHQHDTPPPPPLCITNAWIPHWFSNDLKDLDVLLRIWDVLIVSPPITIVYLSVALVVQFRDSLLRAEQQPIFQAILHHLPSDGLEKYDMVEPILQRCLQALQDYPPELIIDTASLPPIPEWVFHSTAPTDDQVIERLAHLRQVKPVPNPSLPMFESLPVAPPSCLRSAMTEVAVTPSNEESHPPWPDTPNSTPCSTPESVRSVQTIFKATETPKLPKSDIFSINRWYKIVLVCWVSTVFVAVANRYFHIPDSLPQDITRNSTHDDYAPPHVTTDSCSNDVGLDSSMASTLVAPVPCPSEPLSRATSTPNYVNLAWPDSFQIATSIPTGNAHTIDPTSALHPDLMVLLQENAGNMCHPWQEFTIHSHLQCEDLHFNTDSWLPMQSPVAMSVPPEESSAAWLLESMTEISTSVTPAPFQIPESHSSGEERRPLGQLVAVPNATKMDLAPAPVAVDYVDPPSNNLEPSASPEPSQKAYQPKTKPTRSNLFSHSKHLLVGIGNFLVESTEAHLRGRRQAHTLANNVQRFVRDQVHEKNSIFNNNDNNNDGGDVRRDEKKSKSAKPQNRLQDIVNIIQKKGRAATTLALEATAVRLDASRCARADATQLVAKVAQRSKIVAEDGFDEVYDYLLITTNMTLNSVGTATRTMARKSIRMAHQISSVATDRGSKVIRTLHGLTTKNNMVKVISQPQRTIAKVGQVIQGRMGGFSMLKSKSSSIMMKDYRLSSQSVTKAFAAAIARRSGNALQVGVSLLAQGGTVILREFVRLWNQLSHSLPQLSLLWSSAKQILEGVGEKGISLALLAALSMREGVSRIGTITGQQLGSWNELVAQLGSSEKLSKAMPGVVESGSHFFGEMTNRLLENVPSIGPFLSKDLRKIVHVVAHQIVHLFFLLREIGLHFADIIEDTAASFGETTTATVVSALTAGKRTYRGFENGGRNVLLAGHTAWNCMLVYLTLVVSAARQKIDHIGAHSEVETSGNVTENEHFVFEGAIVAADCVLALEDGHHDLQDCSSHGSISGNVTKKRSGQHILYPSLVEMQPIPAVNWVKVRSTSRRSRGAADVAREALLKKSDRNVAIGQRLGLPYEDDFHIRDEATLQRFVQESIGNETRPFLCRFPNNSRKQVIRAFSKGNKLKLAEIQKNIQEKGGRAKQIPTVLAQLMAAVVKTSSHCMDNLALRVHYLQSVLCNFTKNRRDIMRMFRDGYLNLTLREVEHSALLVFYNMFFVMITSIEVGKKELQHSSERQITAVQHVYKESWRAIGKAAALRRDNIGMVKEKIAGVILKAKDRLLRTTGGS